MTSSPLTSRTRATLRKAELGFLGRAALPVLRGATGRDLIPSLRDAGLYELVYGAATAAALVVTG